MRVCLLLALMLLNFNFLKAQSTSPQHSPATIDLRTAEMQRYQQMANQTEAAIFNGDNYDVNYYRMELRLNPDTSIGKYVKGTITTYFKTTVANVTTIKFDFASALTCVAVKYHGSNLSTSKYAKVGNTLEITLPNIPGSGTLDSVSVQYQGVPPVVPFFGNGTGFVRAGSSGSYYIYTLSEPYSAHTWWPCKSMVASDKADSMDIIISTPSVHKVAANGTRVSENITGTNRITVWKHRYPISTYQVALGVGRYTQYPATPTMVNINGTNMPYYNLILGSVTSTMETVLDRTPLMITTLSGLFSDYPFKKEKYGHYTFGFSGGMEHNTFSGMNAGTYNSNSDWSVIAHELGHQWFGAAVTCGSWSDIWVNESFATYSEILVAEFAPSTTPGSTGQTAKTATKNLVMSSTNQVKSIYANDTTDMNAIFTPAVYIYERGAMVLNMLRVLLGDNKFFQALKNYQTDPLLQHNVAYTGDVKRHMEYMFGENLDNFFNDWIYNTGVARYTSSTWNYVNGKVVMFLPQTTQYSGISHFTMPIKVRLSRTSPNRDTTITLYDDNGSISSVDDGVTSSWGTNMISFRLSFEPTLVEFDPLNDVVATGTFTKNAGLIILANNLVELNGVKQNNNSKLNWSIVSGTNYVSMDLERSTDNQNFSSIHSISSATHANETVFNFTDYNTTNAINYYRIKLNLNDGSVKYSDIVALKSVVGESYYSISPNPAKDVVKITTAGKSEKLNISMIAVEGKRVKTLKLQEIGDFNSISIPVKDLKAGQYFIEIERISTGQKITKKIILLP